VMWVLASSGSRCRGADLARVYSDRAGPATPRERGHSITTRGPIEP